jgi:hypothetical protein
MKFLRKVSLCGVGSVLAACCGSPTHLVLGEHPYDRWALHYLDLAREPVLDAMVRIIRRRREGGVDWRNGQSWKEVLDQALAEPLPLDAYKQPLTCQWLAPGESILIIASGVDGVPLTSDDVCVIERMP